MKDIGILGILKESLGLEYLLELRTISNRKQLFSVIELVPEEPFSLSEWKDAVVYLTGCDKDFKNKNEAKLFLQGYAK